MGNTLDVPESGERLLELQLPPPYVEVPTTRTGEQCMLFAQVGTLEDRSAIRNVLWNRPVQIRLPPGTTAVLVSVFAVDPDVNSLDDARNDGSAFFIGEVCLPYDGEGGLAQMGLRPDGEQLCLRLPFVPGARCRHAPPDMLAAAFQQAKRHFQKGMPHVVVWLREVDAASTQSISQRSKGKMDSIGQTNRADALKLELETFALDAQRRNRARTGPEPDAEPDTISVDAQGRGIGAAMLKENWVPAQSLLADLQRLHSENTRLTREKDVALEKLECALGVCMPPPVQTTQQQTPRKAGTEPNWSRTLKVLQTELEHCRQRQERIEATYKDRISNLKQLHWQAQQKADDAEKRADQAETPPASQRYASPISQRGRSPSPSGAALLSDGGASAAIGARVERVSQRIQEAESRRDSINKQLQELQSTEAKDALNSDPVAQRLNAQGHQYKAELVHLQQELQWLHERERGDTQGQAKMREEVQQLYEELDEFSAVREDEKVRSESELRELRAERDAAVERAGDARLEFRRIRAKVEEHRQLGSSAMLASGSLGEADRQRSREVDNEALQQELEHLQRCEVERRQVIVEREREQDQLVEQMRLLSSQAVLTPAMLPGGGASPTSFAAQLEAQAAELELQVAQAKSRCEDTRENITRTAVQVQAVQAQCETLRQVYNQQQKSFDERMRRAPAS